MITKPDEIRNSEIRFRSLFENAVDAIFIATAEGIITEVNASGERLLGYEQGELIGKAIADILKPEELTRFQKIHKPLLEGKTQFNEWELIRKDETCVPVEISASMLPDKQIQAFVRDITERKRLEEISKRHSHLIALRSEVKDAFSSGEKSLTDILQGNMESLVEHLDVAIARVWLLDDEKQVLELQASAGNYKHVDNKYSQIKVGQHQMGKIVEKKESLYSNEILEIKEIDKEWVKSEKLISFAGFPLIVNDKVVGVLGAVSRNLLTEDILETFDSIAALIAQGVVRKQSEDLLREKQELLQTFFNFSTELIHVKDLEGRCLMTNRVFEDVLQLSGEDCYGKTEVELWQASPALQGNTRKSIEDYRDYDADVFETGEVAQKEEVFQVGEDQRIFSTVKKPIYDAKGKPFVIFSISTDITEKKKIEDKLRAEQQLLQSIVDNSTALIHVQDLNHRALLVNKSLAGLLHLEPEQMLGKTEYELWKMSPVAADEMDITYFRAFNAEVLTAGIPMQKEISISLKGEEKRYFLATKSLLYKEDGNPHSICTIATEITEIRRAEKELRANQQLLQTIFDNTPTHIHVKDLEGRFLMTNRAFEQNMRLSHGEMLGKTVYDVWKISPFKDETKEEVDDIPAFDMEAIKTGKPIQKENVTMIDGEETTYLMTKCPLKDEMDKPNSILTIATDITEIKRAEKELRRLQTELAHAARVMTIGTLTSSIAHEVNQPLAAVVTNGNAAMRWLANDPPDLEEVGSAVNRIIRDGIRASEVIKRTRTLLNKSPLQKRPVNINEIVRETIALAQYEIKKNKILLETNFSKELPMIEGDKIHLQQVLLNLIMNAIEATNALTDNEARLSVETRKHEKSSILITVQDSGIGLETDNLEKIFESFNTTKKEGMGMGLSISRSIIEAHGGRLWATANEGKGATFQFTLPVEISE